MSSLIKFENEVGGVGNEFGIVNSAGQVVTRDYLRRYIHCWCRVSDGFVYNRKQNIEYFMSNEFLAKHRGKTASQVGKAASMSDRWNEPVEKKITTKSAGKIRTRAK